MSNPLTIQESNRYNRHILIPEIGIKGQQKLKDASVLVIGAGGLGCPILQYLAAAGIGHLGIVDFDTVDLSNLQRQILFTTDDIGYSKAETAKRHLEKLNPLIQITAYNLKITADNIKGIIKNYDIVMDGTDNFPTRYLVNDACVLEDKINVFGSIFRFEGQVSVFNYPLEDGTRSPNYRDIFPKPPKAGSVPSCAEAGVFGVLPGIIGTFQASEVIKIITGIGRPLFGKLFLLDTTSFTTRIINIRKNPEVVIDQLIDYDVFCNIPKLISSINQISHQKLQEWMVNQEDFLLIDVRHLHEHEHFNIGGTLIPQDEILNRKSEIAVNKNVVFYCQSGFRSELVIQKLQFLYDYKNLYNLSDGIEKWDFVEMP